jgi:hypothetical protein
MSIPQKVARILGILLIAGLCVTPEMMQAVTQQSSQPGAPQSSQQSQSSDNKQGGQNSQSTTKPDDQSQTPTKPQGSGTTVDPSQAPLQPVTTYPEAPTPQQDQQPGNAQPVQQSEQAQQPKKPATEPAGAATAEKVPTTGGAFPARRGGHCASQTAPDSFSFDQDRGHRRCWCSRRHGIWFESRYALHSRRCWSAEIGVRK